MPNWVQWVTFGLALLGAGLSIFNSVMTFRRGRPRLKVSGLVEPGNGGRPVLRIKLVNAGNVPVVVEKLFLTRRGLPKAKWGQLAYDGNGYPHLPRLVQQGDPRTIPIGNGSIEAPLMNQCFTVVAQTEQGSYIKGRCPGLREFAAEQERLRRQAKKAAE